MEKNIMLLFLSTFNLDRSTRQLSTTTYRYKEQDGSEQQITGQHTNEAGLRMAARAGLDKVFAFATDTVKKEFVYRLPDFRDRTCKQIDLFCELIEKNEPGLTARMELVDYNEKGAETDDFISVLKMSGQIQQYLKAELAAGNTVNLYTDMTGGPRNANMLMLLIMQLMQYNGIKLKSVTYSEYSGKNEGKIKNVTAINDLSQLISGAEEFVRYGRCDVLDAYFVGTPKSESLDLLLKAMGNFADALSLCKSGTIAECIDDLKKALDNYTPGEALEEKAFGVLLDRIRQDYAPVFANPDDPLTVIMWCIDKGLLQQAMTLYTERLPEYIVERNIAYTKKPWVRARCIELTKDYIPWQRFLLSNFLYGTGGTGKKLEGGKVASYMELDITNRLKQYLEDISKGKPLPAELEVQLFADDERIGNMLKNLHQLHDLPETIESAERMGVKLDKRVQTKMPEAFKYIKAKYEAGGTKIPMTDYIKSDINMPTIAAFLSNLTNDKLSKLIGFELPASPVVTQCDLDIETSVANRVEALQHLVKIGYLTSEYPMDKALLCVENYVRILYLRNNINHANKKIVISAREMQKCLRDGIIQIRELLAK